MTTLNLTTRWIESAKSKGGRLDVYDATRFGNGAKLMLRVGALRKVWTLYYRDKVEGNRRLKLGVYDPEHPDHLSLKAARATARDTLANLGGVRPSKGIPTVTELCDAYIAEYAMPNKKTWKKDEEHLRLRMKPLMGDLKVNAVDRWQLSNMLKAYAKENPIASNRTLETVSKMFNWAMTENEHFGKWIQFNPALSVVKPALENRRERVLKQGELKRIWRAWEQVEAGPAFMLICYSGQRRSNILRMRWDWLDGGDTLVIPRNETKTGVAYHVPLSTQAQALLDTLANTRATVFPPALARGIDRRHSRVRKLCGVKDFRLHDLRRLCATQLARMHYEQVVISKVLNHSTGTGVQSTYNRHRYLDEVRQASQDWCDWLQGVTHG